MNWWSWLRISIGVQWCYLSAAVMFPTDPLPTVFGCCGRSTFLAGDLRLVVRGEKEA